MENDYLEVFPVAEIIFERNGDGDYVISGGHVVDENPYPFASDYAAYDGEDWRGIGSLSEEGIDDVLYEADMELSKALTALQGLRDLWEYIEPDNPDGGPSGADTCDALYQLMNRLGLEVR